jgi:ASC-1-like (ASCH) protein
MQIPKTITVRFRAGDKTQFKELQTGRKSVETRAATARYQNVKKGDMLVVICGKDKVSKTIKRVRYFKTIDGMLRAVPFKKIMPWLTSRKDVKKAYAGYTGYDDKIKEFGLVAFELA